MTTAICFDLDGTLVQLTKPYATILDEVFEACVGHTDPAWADHYSTCFFEYLRAIEPEPYRQAMADVCETFDLSRNPDRMAEELIDHELAARATDDTIHEVLLALSDRHDHSLGIITNGVGSIQRQKLARAGLDGFFDTIVTSYDVGAHKPDKRIFEAAKDRLDAGRYVMVGDDYEGDIVGAHESGFETIHVRNDDSVVDLTVDSVSDLELLSELNRSR